MGWNSLGTVQVSTDWQSFPEDCLGYEVFRLTHSTIVDPTINSCYLARFFPAPSPGGLWKPFRRIYPSNEAQLIYWEIPQQMKDLGVVVHTLQVRWRLPGYLTDWALTIEALE